MANNMLSKLFPPIIRVPHDQHTARRQLVGVFFFVVFTLVLFPGLRRGLLNALDFPRHYKEYRHFGIPLPGGYSVHGIDVSKYQERVNWKGVRDMKVGQVQMSFVFIKATEGSWLRDNHFRYNWRKARSSGLVRGAYHYFLPDIDPNDQFTNFTKTVKLSSGDLPPVVDVEEARGMTREQVRRYTLVFLKKLEKRYGVKPILYSSQNFYEHYFGSHPAFEEYPLWIAHYRIPKLELQSNSQWHFWQHNNNGRVNGIEGPVDFNVFNGSLEDLNKMCLP